MFSCDMCLERQRKVCTIKLNTQSLRTQHLERAPSGAESKQGINHQGKFGEINGPVVNSRPSKGHTHQFLHACGGLLCLYQQGKV